MRKTITILVLMVVICSSMISCKKEKKVTIAPQYKILFTVKQKPHTSIVNLNTKSKSKQIVARVPLKFDDNIIISPDQKKIAFSVDAFDKKSKNHGIYTMQINGTKLTNITKSIELIKTYGGYPKFCFSPDSQQIALKFFIEEKRQYIIYLVSLDGIKIESLNKDNPSFVLMDQLFFNILESQKTVNSVLYWDFWNKSKDGTIKDNPKKLEYLLFDKKNIGIYSWKTRIFLPIQEIINPTGVYSWCLDRECILYVSKKSENSNYDINIFNSSNNTLTKIITNSPDFFRFLLWYPNGKGFIYADLVSVKHPKNEELHRYDSEFFDLKEFNLTTNKSTSLFSTDNLSSFEYLSETKILIKHKRYESFWSTILNRQTKQEEKYPIPNQAAYPWEPFIIDHNIINLAGKSFLIYDTDTNKITANYEFNKSEIENSRPFGLTLSPDKSIFYFVYRDKMYLFNTHGELEHNEILSSSSFNGSNDSSFLLGFFSSPSEITYLEYVENDNEESGEELNSFNIQTNQLSNLTEALPDLISYKVSPDQQSVALLTKDFGKKIYEVSIMNLNLPQQIKVIKSFPFSEASADSFWDNLYSYAFRFGSAEDAYLYPLFWSNDSQRLFFTSINPRIPKEGEDSIYYPILNQVNVDGSNLKILSKTDFPAFQAHVSPDGKRIVFFQGIKQEVTVMNSKGTGRKILNKQDPLGTYALPMYSPDSKMIAYYFMDAKDVALYLIVNFNQNIIKKKINFSFKQLDSLLPLLDSNNLFSPNNVYTSFVQSLDLEKNLFQAVLLRNLKEEIPLKGNIISFRWSPTGNQLLLLESKKWGQINQLTLYDCTTNSYTPISQDVDQIFDACWSPDGKQILYAGTESKTGQIVFKTSNPDETNQKVLFTFGENPQERPNSIEKIEKLVWLK